VAAHLGAAHADGESLTEKLGDDLWLDFVADTGDDADVSRAVAEMIFQSYRAADGQELPRGSVLVFGGDTAYPVATEVEIHNRVAVPFNQVLALRDDGRPRALLGIPGNHDWYDGLDGFARMFRARRGQVDRASVLADSRPDKTGQIGHLLDWAEAFRAGHHVAKRSALPLVGYTPLQNASYFCLLLAPGLDLWAVDRQLRTVDFTQKSFFIERRAQAPDSGRCLLIADPAHAMLEPYHHGQNTLSALGLDLERDGLLVLTGDSHHYCRQSFGRGLQVIAGGGGAFLHPARIARRGRRAPEAEFPGPRASAALALQVPAQLALGRAGFIAHAAVLTLHAPIYLLGWLGLGPWPAVAVAGVVAFAASALLGGWRRKRQLRIAALALVHGAFLALVPLALLAAVGRLGAALDPLARFAVALPVGVLVAVAGFGVYLTLLTVLGLEHHQAFSTLAHPGYKHFVRLRVARDGSAVEGWVIGKVDTLDPDAEPLLVDRFTWTNPRSEPAA
jgi:hypothetical protein